MAEPSPPAGDVPSAPLRDCAIDALAQWDLDVRTLASPPSGLTVVRGLDARSDVLASRYDELCREYVPMPYEAIAADKPAALNLVPGDWETARALLQG